MARHKPVHARPTSPSPGDTRFLFISQLETVTAVTGAELLYSSTRSL